MPTYAQLMTRHPMCGVSQMGLLRAIYEGGEAMESRYRTLIKQRPSEPNARYELRIAEARYRNYVGPIIDFFAAMLFSTRVLVTAKDEKTGGPVDAPPEFYGHFLDDCDRKGSKVDAIAKQSITDAMVDGYSWFLVHAPAKPGEVESLADFDQLGLGNCWIEGLQADSILDWKDGETGLDWAVRYECLSERNDINASRDEVTHRWTVFYPDRIDVYQTKRDKKKKPAATEDIPRISSEPHSFGKVPLICLDMPVAMHVASRLKDPQLSHFRMSCAQSWSLAASCYAMPIFNLEDQDSKITLAPGLGIKLGLNEKGAYMAPPSDHFEALANEIASEKDEIFRIAHQMALGVDNNAAAVGRSGDSKRADAEATKIALLTIARLAKEAIEKIYDLISDYRGEKLDWSIGGLDDFAAVDIGSMLDSLKKIVDGGGIPSPTFMAEYLVRVAEGILPDLPQATKTTIRNEVVAGVKKLAEEESELSQMTKDLKAAEVENAKKPPAPVVPPGDQKPPAPQPQPSP